MGLLFDFLSGALTINPLHLWGGAWASAWVGAVWPSVMAISRSGSNMKMTKLRFFSWLAAINVGVFISGGLMSFLQSGVLTANLGIGNLFKGFLVWPMVVVSGALGGISGIWVGSVIQKTYNDYDS